MPSIWIFHNLIWELGEPTLRGMTYHVGAEAGHPRIPILIYTEAKLNPSIFTTRIVTGIPIAMYIAT